MGAQTTSMGVVLAPVWWAGPLFGLPGAAAGHVIGRAVASGREAEIREANIPTDEPHNEVELTGHVENE